MADRASLRGECTPSVGASRRKTPAALLLVAQVRAAVPRRVLADERGGSRTPVSGHCGDAVEVDHSVPASFPATPPRTMRKGDATPVPAEGRNCKKGVKGPSERSAFPPGGMSSGQVRLQRRLIAHVPAGLNRRHESRNPHAVTHRPRQCARAGATDAQVRCSGRVFA